VNGFERILAHRIDCQRARPPCPAERHTHNLKSIAVLVLVVNLHPIVFHSALSGFAACYDSWLSVFTRVPARVFGA
jgi:hypothetical protein